MDIFELEASLVNSHTDSLRADAAQLQLLDDVNVPDFWPLGEFSAALSQAITKANTDAEALRAEANRIAAAMDLAVDAAVAVDDRTCRKLEASL